jgi:hypothetical protein
MRLNLSAHSEFLGETDPVQNTAATRGALSCRTSAVPTRAPDPRPGESDVPGGDAFEAFLGGAGI